MFEKEVGGELEGQRAAKVLGREGQADGLIATCQKKPSEEESGMIATCELFVGESFRIA